MRATLSASVAPAPTLAGALAPVPYDEMMAWTELWQACVVVLDRYPHLRPPEPTGPPAQRRLTIPQAAVDAADVHFHLD
jgi:hypothetical protein